MTLVIIKSDSFDMFELQKGPNQTSRTVLTAAKDHYGPLIIHSIHPLKRIAPINDTICHPLII